MKNTEPFVLRNHGLKHIPGLKVEQGFLGKNFIKGCSMQQCNAACCRHGVMLDPKDRDKILEHAPLIQKYMEPHQPKDTAQWFEELDEQDADFPSGRALGTQERSTGCVFLDSAGLCVLQKTAMAEGMPKFSLKPFFCVAYPITLEDGVLVTDDADFTNRQECCSTVRNGEQTVFDVCEEELEYMLGKSGLDELKQHAARR